jgi:hypothetical protein
VPFFGKNTSKSPRLNRVFPVPTWSRPRDTSRPDQTGPSATSLRTEPDTASRATSLPLATIVRSTTPLATAIPEATGSPTWRQIPSYIFVKYLQLT